MFHKGIKFLTTALFISTLGLLSNVAQATSDGNYAGSVAMDLQCSPTTVNFTGAMLLQVSGSNVTLTIGEGSGQFAYTGTGILSGGVANISGNVAVNVSDINIDGVYSPASFNLTVIDNGSTLTVSGSGSASGSSSPPDPCVSLFYGIISTGTLTLVGGEVFNPEITASNKVTDPIVQIAGLRQDVNTFSNRSNAVMRGNGNGFKNNGLGMTYGLSEGLNAGDDEMMFGAWISYNYSDFDYEFAPLAFDGARHSVLAGLDISPWENTVLGLAFGVENADLDTTFNGGEQDTRGLTIAGYFGGLLTDTFSVDATIGITQVDTDQFRTAGATKITSNPYSERYFGALNVNGIWFKDQWVFGARTGLLFARSEQDAFTESDATAVAASSTKVNQWNVGADAAYSFGEWEPFGRVSYENDFSQTEITIVGASQPKNDDDSLVMAVGVRWFGASGLTGNFEMSRRLGKADFDESSLSFTIRGEF